MIIQKSVEKIRISLRYDKNNGYLIWRPMKIYDSKVKVPRNRHEGPEGVEVELYSFLNSALEGVGS
jgi:hypothetical protein